MGSAPARPQPIFFSPFPPPALSPNDRKATDQQPWLACTVTATASRALPSLTSARRRAGKRLLRPTSTTTSARAQGQRPRAADPRGPVPPHQEGHRHPQAPRAQPPRQGLKVPHDSRRVAHPPPRALLQVALAARAQLQVRGRVRVNPHRLSPCMSADFSRREVSLMALSSCVVSLFL